MKQRFTTLMTTLLLSVFFAVSSSAYDIEVDGLYYNLNWINKTAKVTYKEQYKASYSGSVEIPSSIVINEVEYKIASIGERAFYECTGLASITIPNSVTSIGDYAFYGCTGFTSITIPNSIITIRAMAFCKCSGLTSITIPNSVTSIGDGAFRNCSGLTSITIQNSVTSIGNGAFYGCTGLTSITIPNSVTSIGNSAFDGCYNLTSIKIPNSVSSIGERAFRDCSGLTSITIPNSVTTIGDCVLVGCKGIKNTIIVNDMFVYLPKTYSGHYSIPDNITKIIGGAFSGCSKLSSISIPNTVTSIGEGTFWSCSSLESIAIPNSVTSIEKSAFEGCKIKKLYYDCVVKLNIDTYYLKELTIGDSLTIVHDYFKESPLKKIVLGKKVSQIRAEAFKNSILEEFTITGEEPPYIYPNVFGSKDLSKATLYAPESKAEYYQTTEPWSNFGKILTLSSETPAEPKKCATPSISYSEGQLQFSCETEGAKYHYNLSCPDAVSGETSTENNSVTLNAYYDITCYAKAEGFANSDVATAKLYWLTSAESPGTSINAAKTRGVVIQSAAGFITISGLDSTEQVDFYASDGKSLGSAKAIGGTATFAAQSGSVVVVKIGKESVKIAVK